MKRSESDLRFVVVGAFVIMLVFAFMAAVIRSRVHIGHVDVHQKAQLHSMDAALELFNHEFKAYPPSDANDPTGKPYCGAMKLAEALMGQDLQGFHPQSAFRFDGLDANSLTSLYPANPSEDNLKARRVPYLSPPHALDNVAERPFQGLGQKGGCPPYRLLSRSARRFQSV